MRFEAELAKGGTFVRLRVRRGPVGGGRRGEIKDFSHQSQRRMLDFFNKLPRAYRSQALFITLTYPREFSPDRRDWKRDLDVFFKRFARRFPDAVSLWKLEFQRRGAPHFHVLVWGCDFVPVGWLSRVWYNVVGSDDPRHLAAGTQVQEVRNEENAVAYLFKYIVKEDRSGNRVCTGRIWGVRNRKCCPTALAHHTIETVEFYSTRRQLRRWLEGRLGRKVTWSRRAGEGLTAYIDTEQASRLFDSLDADAARGEVNSELVRCES